MKCLTTFVHEHGLAVDAGLAERLGEDHTGRTDERLAGAVLAVTRLLPDEHEASGDRPLPEDHVRGPRPQVAGVAPLGRSLEQREVGTVFRGHEPGPRPLLGRGARRIDRRG